MLCENIRNLRKAKGLSQEELAIKLNVVRQTVSKWEKGLSVPDCEMLLRIAEELDTTVTVLLGETVAREEPEDIKILSAKLELLNEQFSRQNELRRKRWRLLCICIVVLGSAVLLKELIECLATQMFVPSMNENVAIIGGADGPTRIFIARAVSPLEDWFLAAIAVVFAGIGLYRTRRR
jgi:transcriptional regulator with XRE-family HTH domain